MKEYKFRGKVIKDGAMKGKVVYGDLITPWADDQKYPMIRDYRDYKQDNNGNTSAHCFYWDVEPDSVAQLVGKDKNGIEVYEGDKLEDLVVGGIFITEMCHISIINQCILRE